MQANATLHPHWVIPGYAKQLEMCSLSALTWSATQVAVGLVATVLFSVGPALLIRLFDICGIEVDHTTAFIVVVFGAPLLGALVIAGIPMPASWNVWGQGMLRFFILVVSYLLFLWPIWFLTYITWLFIVPNTAWT